MNKELADALRSVGLDPRFPDSRPSEYPRLHRALRRRRAKNAIAKQSRKRNR